MRASPIHPQAKRRIVRIRCVASMITSHIPIGAVKINVLHSAACVSFWTLF